jgi:hypothetical protein
MQNFLVSYNKNGKLAFHEIIITDNLPACILINEDLIFTAMFMNGVRVTSPIDESQLAFFQIFTPLERYLIASDFFDSSLISESDYRNANSKFCPVLFPLNPQFATLNYLNNGTLHWTMQGTYNNPNIRIWYGTMGSFAYQDVPLVNQYGDYSHSSNEMFGGNNENFRVYLQSLDTNEVTQIGKLYGTYEFFDNPY